MRVMGEAYATMPDRPSPKVTREEAIQHCQQFVRYYTSAAKEAEALANFHTDFAGASR